MESRVSNNKHTPIITIITLSLALSSCSHPTATGAAAGAAAVAPVAIGTTVATFGLGAVVGVPLLLGGALFGGLFGHAIGKRIQAQDRVQLAEAVTQIPVTEGPRWEVTDHHWANPKMKTTFDFHPIRQTHENGIYCREYQITVSLGRKKQMGHEKTCLMSDGRWAVKERFKTHPKIQSPH